MVKLRELELKIWYAWGLKDVNPFTTMSPYAEVWVPSSPTVASSVHTKGGTNPSWNEHLRLVCDESLIEQGYLYLHVKLFDANGLFGSTLIGSLSVPLGRFSEEEEMMYCWVQRPSGRFHGYLCLSVKLGDLIPPSLTAAVWYNQFKQQTSKQYQDPPQECAPLWSLLMGFYLAQGLRWPILPPAPQVYPPLWSPLMGFHLAQRQFPREWPILPPAPQGYYPQQPYAPPVQVIQKQPAQSGLGQGRSLVLGKKSDDFSDRLGQGRSLVLGKKSDDFSDRPGGDGDCGGGCF